MHMRSGPVQIPSAGMLMLDVCSKALKTGQWTGLLIRHLLQGAFDSFAMGNYPFPTYYIGGSAEHPLPAFPMRAACAHLGGSFDTDKTSSRCFALSCLRCDSALPPLPMRGIILCVRHACGGHQYWYAAC